MAPRRPTRARLCRLAQTAGRPEACSERACPFWEPGGAALPGRCAFEAVDLDRRRELAARLLELRDRLARAPSEADRRAAHDLSARLRAGHD